MVTTPRFLPLADYPRYPKAKMHERARALWQQMSTRRTVRDFSHQSAPREVIEECIRTAGTAPSGANQQPWHFAVVADPAIKRQIRQAAEEEERAFYEHRAPDEWLDALAHLGTDADKPFLETAPYLIVVFALVHHVDAKGEKIKHYYPYESTGLATGMLITALHNVGLASLTHTPNPMKFLNQVLGRPSNERPFLILVTGYPAENVQVPDIKRRDLGEICTFY
ncbi:MAG: nitroreductase family protein [Acidiferrobacteraceae bacterium]|nr:nitroreductase family protein [Acidiferrobacteraceae bacterium]